MGEESDVTKMDKRTVSSLERNFIQCDHSTNECQDEYILASIFPPEVWSIILLDKVGTDSKNGARNLTNCSMASSYFRNLLSGHQKFFLFPKVLEILAIWIEDQETKLGKNNDGPIPNESGNVSDDANPHSIFKLTDILICREVCHQWKNSFEEFYQNPYRYSRMHFEKNELSHNLCEINMRYEINYEEEEGPIEETLNRYRQPSVFLDHFRKTHDRPSNQGNPFPARALTFGDVQFADVEILEPEQIFYQDISQIVLIYGKHLWYCDMKLTDLSFRNRISFYYKLKPWLSSMPNLKALKIECDHIFEPRELGIVRELMDDMQRSIFRNPLQEIKNLQFLEVQKVLADVFNEIIRTSGNGITKLAICREKLNDDSVEHDIYSENHPLLQLKELSINFHSVKHFEQMENSAVAANWKLKAFHFLYDGNAKFVEWSRVFNMISSKWADTLTHLSLRMPGFESKVEKYLGLEASLSRTAFQLPLLKRVRLDIKDACSIDFLLPSMNTLEIMEIAVNYNVNKEKAKVYYQSLEKRQYVKFLGFENEKQSFARNILEKFPNLYILRKRTLLNQEKTDEECMTEFSVYEADLDKIKAGQ